MKTLRLTKCLVGAVFVVLLTAACVNDDPHRDARSDWSLITRMRGAEAVVTGVAAPPVGTWIDHADNDWLQVNIELTGILYHAGPHAPHELADLSSTDSITVLGRFLDQFPAGDEAVYILGGVDPDDSVFTEVPADWAIRMSATIDSAGSVTFLGRVADEYDYAADFEKLHRRATTAAGMATTSSELDVLVAFAKETAEVNMPNERADSYERGPILLAFQDRELDHIEWWESIDPALRPLDVELTPEHVLKQLEDVQIFVLVEEAAKTTEGLLVIQTPWGIAHQADLTGGSHPASLLVPPGEDWTALLTPDPFNGVGGVEIAQIPIEQASDGFVFIEVRASAVADADVARAESSALAPARYEVSRALTQAGFDALLGQLHSEQSK